MLYLDEEEMLARLDIVPCRGRDSLADTMVRESFTAKELDALAPLTKGDIECLKGDRYARYVPRPETIERLESRILAARRIKYGR